MNIIVLGLSFGDEGKGSLVDALVRRTGAKLVVRFNGGAQAAHHVVTDDGRSHCFAQWGSGTLAGARTYLSRFMLVDPFSMHREAMHLRESGIDPYPLLTVDRECLVITPYHKAMNRLREAARGPSRHGSCGMGIGEAVADSLAGCALYASDLTDRALVRHKLDWIRDRKMADLKDLGDVWTRTKEHEQEWWAVNSKPEGWQDAFALAAVRDRLVDRDWLRAQTGDIVFEGAQGVLLDQTAGFEPFTTWSDCTFAHALTLIGDAAHDAPTARLGALRSFSTRHGPGPFPAESVVNCMRNLVNDDHNRTGPWQGTFRVGHFDAAMTRYALSVVGGVDGLAITHMDKVAEPWFIADYEIDADPAKRTTRAFNAQPMLVPVEPMDFLDALEQRFDTPVAITSEGRTPCKKAFHALIPAATV